MSIHETLLSFLAMKPSRLETTCSVTVDLIELDMLPPDQTDLGGV
ncbi:MAG: hypothetical protein WCB99_02915 [Candidatus Cybelea sp.]